MIESDISLTVLELKPSSSQILLSLLPLKIHSLVSQQSNI